MLGQLNLPEPAPLSIFALLLNLAIGVVLALGLRWHFERFGSTLTNRAEFAQVLPFIILTTTLIITIVKSSLALSLGLVGALSIVRFRTPVKEPEELAYLFLAIAIGLGLGADQRWPTIVAGLAIMLTMALIRQIKGEVVNKNLYLSIDWKQGSNERESLEQLNRVILKHAKEADLRRFDVRAGGLEVVYHVDINTMDGFSKLVDELKANFSEIGVTLIDQNQMPSL